MMPEPGADLAEIFDKAKLTGANFLRSNAGMTVLVTKCRADLNRMITEYIKKRDLAVAESVKKGKL